MAKPPTQNTHLGRREVLRILAFAGVAGATWKLNLLGRAPAPITRSRTLMGTEVHLTLFGEDPAATARAATATLRHMADLEALLSRYRPTSQVSQLNRTGQVDRPSRALLDVLGLAERIAGLGDGAFDITVQPVLDLYANARRQGASFPSKAAIEDALKRVDYRAITVTDREVAFRQAGMAITLDGIGKGYIVDRGVRTLRAHGLHNVFVEAGGDLVASGDKRPGHPWRVGIRSPRGLALQARLDATDQAIATSGDYMQSYSPDFKHHHIVDPRSGYSAPELASSTVIASDAATADALATLTMVLGPRRGRELLEDLPGCEGYFITKNLEVHRTSGFVVKT